MTARSTRGLPLSVRRGLAVTTIEHPAELRCLTSDGAHAIEDITPKLEPLLMRFRRSRDHQGQPRTS